jgi:hypothetical protein
LATALDLPDLRVIVQEAFVNGAEFFDIEGGVIHPAWGFRFLVVVVHEVLERYEEIAVGNGPVFQFDRGEEVAVEDGEFQESYQGLVLDRGAGLVIAQEVPEDAQAAPEVVVVGVGLVPVD